MEPTLIVAALAVAVVAWFAFRSKPPRHGAEPEQSALPAAEAPRNAALPQEPEPVRVARRVRLSHQQFLALNSATLTEPIYGENPSFRSAQMPNNRECFDLRTIASLQKRNYLVSDGKGGYLLTLTGRDALESYKLG